jgi:hypothetical protein
MTTEQLLAFAEANDINDLYVLIRGRYIEELMEYHWFNPECYRCTSYGLQLAYFVPIRCILKILEPG